MAYSTYVLVCAVLLSVLIVKSNSKPQYEINDDGQGNTNFRYQSLDGTIREEQISIGNERHVVTGFYSYFDADGKQHNVRYVADENGFRPSIDDGPILDIGPDISSSAIGSLQGGGLG